MKTPEHRRNHEYASQDKEEENRYKGVTSVLMDIFDALDRLTSTHKIYYNQNNIHESKRRNCEIATILALAVAAVVAAWGIIQSHSDTRKALRDASTIASRQHNDTLDALLRADDANKTAREAFTAVQRPFIVFSKFQTVPFKPTENVAWEIQTVEENSGNTIARSVRSHISYCFLPKGIANNFNFPDLGERSDVNIVLGPKANTTLGAFAESVQSLKTIQDRKTKLFIWGRAVYHDIFKNTESHITRFCTQLSLIAGDLVEPKNGTAFTFTQCEKNNCVDNDCPGDPDQPPRVVDNPADIGCIDPSMETNQ